MILEKWGRPMKLGIDSYSFHRFFGETYSGLEVDPGERITALDFLDYAVAQGVEAVSLESCFLPAGDRSLTTTLRNRLDTLGLDRVWAWGHPRGFHSGSAPEALDSALTSLADAEAVGAKVMRICAGGRGTRPDHWALHKAALLGPLKELLREAESRNIVLAVENHIDLLTDEIIDLVETLASPYFGICLDTANNLRLYENPKHAIRRMAPYARATHIKDIIALDSNPHTIGFWPSVPVGDGLIDMRMVLDELARAGFAGVLAIEIDYLAPGYGDERAALKKSISFLRRLLAERADSIPDHIARQRN